jgi:hypothetical protein
MDESYTFESGSQRAEQPWAPPTRTRTRPFRAILVASGAAFLLGSALTWYLAREVDWSFANADLTLSADEAPPAETPRATAAPTPAAVRQGAAEARRTALAVEEVFEQQGGIDQRVAAMEQRLARLDLQAQAAAGNAARAEGLLIAFAARRAIERGAPLGYLSEQLQLRFADALPNAVEAVTAAGEDPVTIDQLLARLEGLAPALAQEPAGEGVLPRIGRELSQLFVIRTEDTPSPRPQSRLQRARLFLESGRVDAAIGEVSNMPNAAPAQAWIADAERYHRALRGLELLETTAILEPRRLRDGTGNLVEQPSPAA